MTQHNKPTPTAKDILAALKTLRAADEAGTLAAAVVALDGVDARAAAVDDLANTLAALAVAVEADIDAQADSHLRAMEYGDALHLRALAASVAEYHNGVEASHERSFEFIQAIEAEDEPTDAEAYGAALEFLGLSD